MPRRENDRPDLASVAAAQYGQRGAEAAPDAALIAYTGHPGAFTPEDAAANLPQPVNDVEGEAMADAR